MSNNDANTKVMDEANDAVEAALVEEEDATLNDENLDGIAGGARMPRRTKLVRERKGDGDDE